MASRGRVGLIANRLALTAALVAALGAAPSAAQTARLGIDVFGLSYHFERHDDDGVEFNETNLGGGLNWVIRRGPRHTVFADVGLFQGSYRKATKFGSVAWTHRLLGPVQGGFGLAVGSSPSVNDGELFMVPGPLLAWRMDRAALHVTYIPGNTETNAYPSVAAWATLYPFGPAGVTTEAATTASAAARDGGGDLGLEFTVDGGLQLSAPDGAAIALKRRHGARGWRLSLDTSAYVADWDDESHPPGAPGDSWDSDEGSFSFAGRAQRLFYGSGSAGPVFFWGLGPFLAYDSDEREWQVGAVGSWGVEWRLAGAVSLGAEYGLDLVYAEAHGSAGWNGERLTRTSRSLELLARDVRLACTVWLP